MIQRVDELYHFGVPGMKWGKRRAVAKAEQRKASIKKIKKMGADEVKYRNRVKMTALGIGTFAAVDFTRKFGGTMVRELHVRDGGPSKTSHAFAIGSLAAIGAMSVASIKKTRSLHKENVLANQYETKRKS